MAMEGRNIWAETKRDRKTERETEIEKSIYTEGGKKMIHIFKKVKTVLKLP